MNKDIQVILDDKTAEFKKKEYSFFEQYINDAYCFSEDINGQSYDIELHVIENKKNKDELLVMCEISQRKALIGNVGRANYFGISSSNDVRTLRDEEVF